MSIPTGLDTPGKHDDSRHIDCTNPDPLMSVPDWAQYHSLTERYVRQLIASKRIDVIRIGRVVRLRRSWGDDLAARCTVPAARPLASQWATR